MIILDALERKDLQEVKCWRNEVLETLRTPFPLTKEMQDEYYDNVICNRFSTTRYWAIKKGEVDQIGNEKIKHDFKLIGYGGLENIIWEYGTAELSIIMSPSKRGQGLGSEAVKQILDKAFDHLRLEMVWGEVYHCGAVGFWEKYCKKDKRCFFTTTLPKRKFYDGKYWDSFYFCFTKDGK